MRYSGASWRPFPSSGSYTGGPKRLVIHTTEGSSIAGAEAAYRANGVAPHFTADPALRRLAQHIDTSVAASAMANRSGGVQTNRRSAIQIEVVGFAARTQDLDDGDLGWLGKVLFGICWTEGIPMHVHPRFVGTEAGTIASASAPQRMTFAAWDAFHGVCGHQHVPENHHWDPGRFPYDRMLSLITEDAMTPEQEARILKAINDRSGLIVNTVNSRTGLIYNAVRAINPDVDESVLAEELAPHLVPAIPSLSDSDLQRIAEAVLDEQAERLQA